MVSTTIRSTLVVPLLNFDATWSWKRASLMRVLWLARKALQDNGEGLPGLSSITCVMQCTTCQHAGKADTQGRTCTGLLACTQGFARPP
jgi:hypothetical protein